MMNLIEYLCVVKHEIWNTLEVTHEGTNQVKETKISMLALNKNVCK